VAGNNEREGNRIRHSRTQNGEEKKNWIVDASVKKNLSSGYNEIEENERIAQASRKLGPVVATK
jgi:hypothetical protein